MIVDIHTHTPTHVQTVPAAERQPNVQWRPDRVVEAAVSWDDYLAAMQPVDRACVFGIRFKGGDMPVGREGAGVRWVGNVNDQTADFVRGHAEKLIGFMSVHPDEGDPVQEIERCVHELGLRGIKLGPNYQGFEPLDAGAFRVYEAAQRMSLPIVFHQGTSPMRSAPLRYAHPLVMDEIAMAFPELRVVMAHLGHPWHADTLAVIRKHPHVYADVSAQFFRPWSQYHALRLATEWGVLDKLLFGSDFPVATPQETIDGLLAAVDVAQRGCLPPLDRDALQAIVHRDSLSALALA
ncbi:MAG: amidohydrolase family protein [Chloroflexi bacterium]|nr:amidohydrolase family protein [Chloroflexota bacterium]